MFKEGSHVGPLKAFRHIMLDRSESREASAHKSPGLTSDVKKMQLTMGQTTIKNNKHDYDPQHDRTYDEHERVAPTSAPRQLHREPSSKGETIRYSSNETMDRAARDQ